MERIQELLARITELSDEELAELKDLVLAEIDGAGADAEKPGAPGAGGGGGKPTDEAVEMSRLEELAEATTAIQAEFASRQSKRDKQKENADKLASFRESFAADEDEFDYVDVYDENGEFAGKQKKRKGKKKDDGGSGGNPANAAGKFSDESDDGGSEAVTADGAQVPEDRKPKREVARTTVIRAGADLPGWALGAELTSADDLANAFTRRIQTMRGISGGDGDKLIVASAGLDGMRDEFKLAANDAESNLRKVMANSSTQAIVAAGGLAAPEETKYDLFGVGDTDRPVRGTLPVYNSPRGGVRFMKPPTLNDVDGVVGIWTVADDIAAATNATPRKPAFRVLPGPEIVVDIQAITMIMTFGNMMSRAYPELVARHNELGMIAHARVAEQQLLTQIGALSTKITGSDQQLGATRTVLNHVSMAAASYRNRHRLNGAVPLKAIMPQWFLDMLRADIVMQHPGDGLEIFAIADAQIEQWFRARNITITWAMDGEAGQDFTAMTDGADGFAPYPENVIWYLFAEGTFAFMDGGTLDLGLVRDSTLNAANDYQMFVESFENVVMFGHESLRVTSPLRPTGQGSADVDPFAAAEPAA